MDFVKILGGDVQLIKTEKKVCMNPSHQHKSPLHLMALIEVKGRAFQITKDGEGEKDFAIQAEDRTETMRSGLDIEGVAEYIRGWFR